MKKRLIIILSALLVFTLVIVAVIYYNNQNNTPQGTIRTFEKAFNRADVNAMANCLIPELKEEVNTIIKKADEAIEAPVALLLETIPFLSGILDFKAQPKVNMEILKEDIQEKEASITVKIKIDKTKISPKADINLIKIKSKWYIESIKPKLF
ncbi:MAG: hypothetical protein K0S76_1621 [Herbinix sp.]|jgi:uncharacterized membrane protein YvbJ|nr:hypothetical protein [Herbinix sp.]